MNKLFTKIASVTLGFAMAIGVGVAVAGKQDVKAAKAAYDYQEVASGSCSGFTSGYGVHKTSTSGGNTWVGSYGQAGYLGANSDKNYNNAVLSNANDLAVAKGYDSSITNTTKGYVVFYCETGFANIGKVVFSTTAKATGGQAASYLLYKPAGGSWGKVTLASDSVSKQGDKVSTSAAYTLTYTFTPSSTVTQFAMLFYRNGYTRHAGASMSLYSATEISGPSVYFNNPTDSVGKGASVTNVATGDNLGTATISYTSSDTNVATVNASTGEVTGVAFGSATITAKATVDNVDYSDNYTVYVTSSENAYYTIAQARAAIDSGKGLANQYVKGIVYKVDNYSEQYHSITYWISDDGTNTVPFEVYSGLGINGAAFSSKDDMHVGDIVVVKGELKKSGSTYEFNYNNELVSQISVASIAVKTAPTKVEYDQGESFDPTGLVVTATYNDNPATTHDYAYADLGTAFSFNPSTSTALTDEESVTITLFGKSTTQAITVTGRTITSVTVTGEMTNKTYVKNAAWNFAGLSLTVTYNSGDPAVVALSTLAVGTDFTVDKEKADGSTSLTIAGTYEGTAITSRTITGIEYVSEVSFVAGTDKGTSGTTSADTLAKYGITVSGTSMATTTAQYRIYSGSTLTISSSGENIRKIEFTDAGDTSNPASRIKLKAGETGEYADLMWLGDDDSVAFSPEGQARVSKIKVTTASGQAEIHVDGLAVNGAVATIGQEFEVSVVKGKTHTLDVAVTPDDTTDSKDIAYSVYSGTGATVDNKGVITAGTIVGDTAVIKAESVADSTYYVLFNVTVIDAKTVYALRFANESSGDSNIAVTTTTWSNFTLGDKEDLTCTATAKVYPSSNTMMKFGGGSDAGTITLKTPNSVEIEKVLVHAKLYGTDKSSVVVNSSDAQNITTNFSYLVFDLEDASDTITIAASTNSKCRFYVDEIVLVGAEDKAALGAYGYAATFMNALDEECASLAVTTATWGTLNTAWTTLGNDNGEQSFFLAKDTSQNGDVIEKSLSRYDYIVGKYNKGQGLTNYNDFMNRDPAAIAGLNYQMGINENNDVATIVVIIAIASISAFGCLLILKKRKHQ